RNIATYHREHERYYTMNQLELAADLTREANRLKIVADAWLGGTGPAAPAPAGVDYADPRFQPAGCPDLNALPAIAAIGVLMEGEREPAEIRALKGKLMGIALGLEGAGRWLAEKIDAAWQRESVLLTPELVDAAWPRLLTIVTDWRGARDMELVGKLLAVAVEGLEKIDFSPAAVRESRESSAKMLRTVGWVLDLVARRLARSASSLGENDEAWTRYLAALNQVRPRA
ncbi:MAG: hypothetical protein ACREMR_01925, partial [Gemmatimonadales bacterium]